MCRLAGFWDLNYRNDYNIEKVISDMSDVLKHGGPDDSGISVHTSLGLALGHRRLAIFDISKNGRQPMTYNNGRYEIIYNGEIYNFPEIRSELESLGHKFLTNTDTEVILHAYQEWGIKCLKRFHGMWAFALFDNSDKKIILCRDRVGVKPLYWYFNDQLLIFSSELKALFKHPSFRKEISSDALCLYFKYGYIPAPYAIFQHVKKILPATFLTFDSYGTIIETKYWNLPQKNESNRFREEIDIDYVEKELESILDASFTLRMRADVPVGIFFSGGLDSALLVSLLQKHSSKNLSTFTIGFHEKDYNELPFASEIASLLKVDHTTLLCTQRDALNALTVLPDIFDEPFADDSAIPTLLVSQLARQQVKVSLSADGGDELFCGYKAYKTAYHKLKYLQLFPSLIQRNISAFLMYCDVHQLPRNFTNTTFYDKYCKLSQILRIKGPMQKYYIIKSYFSDFEIRKTTSCFQEAHLLFHDLSDDHLIENMMIADYLYYLPDNILTKLDRCTMAVALEGREPFLDHTIIEYAMNIPIQMKLHNNVSKYILKKIAYKYLPNKIVDRPKRGFGIPLKKWLYEDFKNMTIHYLIDKKRNENDTLINTAFVSELVQAFYSGKAINPKKIWLLLQFELWRERWYT